MLLLWHLKLSCVSTIHSTDPKNLPTPDIPINIPGHVRIYTFFWFPFYIRAFVTFSINTIYAHSI